MLMFMSNIFNVHVLTYVNVHALTYGPQDLHVQ